MWRSTCRAYSLACAGEAGEKAHVRAGRRRQSRHRQMPEHLQQTSSYFHIIAVFHSCTQCIFVWKTTIGQPQPADRCAAAGRPAALHRRQHGAWGNSKWSVKACSCTQKNWARGQLVSRNLHLGQYPCAHFCQAASLAQEAMAAR